MLFGVVYKSYLTRQTGAELYRQIIIIFISPKLVETKTNKRDKKKNLTRKT